MIEGYTAVSCARWEGIDPHKYVEVEAARLGVDPDKLRQVFFNVMQWTHDNDGKTRELWGDR